MHLMLTVLWFSSSEGCQAHNRELGSPVVVRMYQWWSPVLFREVTDASCQKDLKFNLTLNEIKAS
ncbi:hypothetical protein E2C01_030550 [Portunus trituberculatus]|uniref:Uncharacterized protein n=1 Tax=Portunus trituberculatus TaxID=210409 RepID=A0A5B7EV33_PORTR|nr:hypothetical protein [Portunus trituberculatus]